MISNMGSAVEGAAPERSVIVYTRAGCSACRAVKEFLSGKGVPFKEKDIAEDPIAADELATLTQGAATAPVTVIGETVVLGFDRAVLTRELGLN